MIPFMGNDGFYWWMGKVVDTDNDPLKLGRVKVRMFAIHGEEADVSDDVLPWVLISQDPTSAAAKSKGKTPTGLSTDSMVWGFFLDGKDKQTPLLVGSIAGIPDGVNDLHQLSRGENNLKKGDVEKEPKSPYNAQYPHNKVISEDGYTIELDNTPGYERVHVYHKSGSYYEIGPSGQVVYKSVDNSYDINVKNKEVFVKSSYNIKAAGVSIDSPLTTFTGHIDVGTGASGVITSSEGKVITIKNGIITKIS